MTHAALALILGFILSSPARALVLRGAVSSALGGTGVAGIDAAEGALLNPAAVTIFPNYGVEGMFRDGSPLDGQHRHGWSVGAADNSPESLFSGALHYARTRDVGRVDGAADGELYHGAFGYRFTSLLALGASVYRVTYRTPAAAVRLTTQLNYDLGTLLMFSPSFGFGYVLRGLAQPGAEVPRPLRETLEQTAGVYASLGQFVRVRADLGRHERDNPDQKLTYAAGAEVRMRSFFLLRLGFRHDEAGEGRLATAGLSLDGPKLKLDYALVKSVVGSSGALHSVDLRIPF